MSIIVWQLIVAFGNLIVIIVEEANGLKSRVRAFLQIKRRSTNSSLLTLLFLSFQVGRIFSLCRNYGNCGCNFYNSSNTLQICRN